MLVKDKKRRMTELYSVKQEEVTMKDSDPLSMMRESLR